MKYYENIRLKEKRSFVNYSKHENSRWYNHETQECKYCGKKEKISHCPYFEENTWQLAWQLSERELKSPESTFYDWLQAIKHNPELPIPNKALLYIMLHHDLLHKTQIEVFIKTHPKKVKQVLKIIQEEYLDKN